MKFVKKAAALSLAAMMTVSAFAGCGSSSSDSKDNSSSSEASKVEVSTMNKDKLTVGSEIGYPPFESFAEDGTTPIGYDIDLGKEVADRLGLEIEFINTSFDGILEGIGTNYDIVISAITINEDRKKNVLFCTPYIDNYQSVVVKKGSTLEIKSLNDLDGKSVSLQKATTSDELLEELMKKGTIKCTSVAQEKVTTCFTQLTNGDVDVVLCDSTVADGYVAKNPDKYEIAFQDTTSPEQFGIACGKEDTQMQKAIDDVLAEMKKDGTLDDLYSKWFE